MSTQRRVLAMAAVLAVTAAAAACGNGSPGQRIGGAAQGISIEVPTSYTVLDLTSQATAVDSLAKLGLTKQVAQVLVPQVQQLQQRHAVVAVDARGPAATAGTFADTISAYCAASDMDLSGSGAVATIKKQLTTQLGGLQVSGVEMASTPVGGIPGLAATYALGGTSAGTLAGGQLEVAPKPQRLCFVTLTASPGTFSADTLSTAAQTAQFS